MQGTVDMLHTPHINSAAALSNTAKVLLLVFVCVFSLFTFTNPADRKCTESSHMLREGFGVDERAVVLRSDNNTG